jgi:hypothetical protein
VLQYLKCTSMIVLYTANSQKIFNYKNVLLIKVIVILRQVTVYRPTDRARSMLKNNDLLKRVTRVIFSYFLRFLVLISVRD